MNEVAYALQENWVLFRDVNGMAGHHPVLDALMVVGANDLIFLLPALLLLFWFLVARYSPLLRLLGLSGGAQLPARRLAQQMALLGCGAVALALAINVTLGHIFYEPRPFVSHPGVVHLLISHPADASFPSDHTAVAFAVATTLVLYLLLVVAAWMPGKSDYRLAEVGRSLWPVVIPALLAAIAVLAAVVIGLARVYVGVHYPGDIAGGAGCGFIAASFLATLRPRLVPVLDGFIRVAERVRLA